jgi:hypothetical protein
MVPIFKILAILVVVAVAMTIWERWFNIFYLGRLFDNIGSGMALLGFAVPIVTFIAGVYCCVRIVRA